MNASPDTRPDRVVELTQAMVRIPSLSGQERDMADFIQRKMLELGFTDVSRDENGSVLGIVGPVDQPIALLFDAHMDVVPPAGHWTVDPFGGLIRDGRLYGRGTTDMKGGLAAALCAVATAAQEGGLKQRLAVSATVMEEVIEGHGLSAVLDRCAPRAVVICEPSDLCIKLGQKGRTELLITIKGKPHHAALKVGRTNTIIDTAKAILALEAMTLARDDRLGEAILVPTDIISTPYPSISLTPSAVTLRYDRRTLAGESQEAVIEQVAQCLRQAGIGDFDIEVSTGEVAAYTGKSADPVRHLSAWLLPEDHRLAAAMIGAVQAADTPVTVNTWQFCTNGSESAGRRAIPTIGLGPGKEEDAHTADESIELKHLIKAERIYMNLCHSLAT
ncbi:YgeY family selenium metabolism-linked hydrolase [Castellaniella sp. WN]